jgi:hypothetical protein
MALKDGSRVLVLNTSEIDVESPPNRMKRGDKRTGKHGMQRKREKEGERLGRIKEKPNLNDPCHKCQRALAPTMIEIIPRLLVFFLLPPFRPVLPPPPRKEVAEM